jgi:sodium-independent sulfate anion transporter 11
MIILTLASWLYAKPRKTAAGKFPIRILQTVPRGLKQVHQPKIDSHILSALGPHLPVATIVLLLEHIAIAKCTSILLWIVGGVSFFSITAFGRLNNYKINPNQELIAIGVTNTVGSCFGAYAATGSFSRTALKSKCGVRTPAAGIVTGIVVLVALYCLTDAFYWIPNAGLSAVIIHAVADLVASPAHVYSFWRISPLEFFIWLAAVLVTVFSSIENGIYTSVAASVFLLLLRVAHPRRNFLGRVRVHLAGRNHQEQREVYLPLKNNGVTNPAAPVIPPYPGVIIYRLEEAYLYPNSSGVDSELVDFVREHMKRGVDVTAFKNSERPWNDVGPPRGVAIADLVAANEAKADIRALVLDFSSMYVVEFALALILTETRHKAHKSIRPASNLSSMRVLLLRSGPIIQSRCVSISRFPIRISDKLS